MDQHNIPQKILDNINKATIRYLRSKSQDDMNKLNELVNEMTQYLGPANGPRTLNLNTFISEDDLLDESDDSDLDYDSESDYDYDSDSNDDLNEMNIKTDDNQSESDNDNNLLFDSDDEDLNEEVYKKIRSRLNKIRNIKQIDDNNSKCNSEDELESENNDNDSDNDNSEDDSESNEDDSESNESDKSNEDDSESDENDESNEDDSESNESDESDESDESNEDDSESDESDDSKDTDSSVNYSVSSKSISEYDDTNGVYNISDLSIKRLLRVANVSNISIDVYDYIRDYICELLSILIDKLNHLVSYKEKKRIMVEDLCEVLRILNEQNKYGLQRLYPYLDETELKVCPVLPNKSKMTEIEYYRDNYTDSVMFSKTAVTNLIKDMITSRTQLHISKNLAMNLQVVIETNIIYLMERSYLITLNSNRIKLQKKDIDCLFNILNISL